MSNYSLLFADVMKAEYTYGSQDMCWFWRGGLFLWKNVTEVVVLGLVLEQIGIQSQNLLASFRKNLESTGRSTINKDLKIQTVREDQTLTLVRNGRVSFLRSFLWFAGRIRQ